MKISKIINSFIFKLFEILLDFIKLNDLCQKYIKGYSETADNLHLLNIPFIYSFIECCPTQLLFVEFDEILFLQ